MRIRRAFLIERTVVLALSVLALSCPCLRAKAPNASAPAHELNDEEKAEEAQDEIERQRAYDEAVKLQEERKKRLIGLSEEARQKLRERESRLPNANDGYAWQSEADAYELTAPERALLEKQKFAVSAQEFLQSFQPYDNPKTSVFITSDSLLNAFHVLFEDSFRELEIRRAGQLKHYLEEMMTTARQGLVTLPYRDADYGPSWRHAQLAVGPAMRLLGTPLEFFDEGERKEIEGEVAAILEAKGSRLPAWLEPVTADFLAMDYGRFEPVGFYTRSRLLENYFRAVRWLQTVPFRIDRDVELGALGLLARELPTSKSYPRESYLLSYASFLGRPDGSYLSQPMSILSTRGDSKTEPSFRGDLDRARKWLKPQREVVPFGLAAQSSPPSQQDQSTFHLLAAFVPPETALHQELLQANKAITGLQYVALNGSQWASSCLDPSQKDSALDNAIRLRKKSKEDYLGDSPLYSKFDDVVSSLFELADRDAPPFMMSDAWAAKSCQTALASWTQMRHTFALQTKISFAAPSGSVHPPGFIEPNPAFLRAFVRLVHAATQELEKFDVFETSGAVISERLWEKAEDCEAYVRLAKQLRKRKLAETAIYAKVQRIFMRGFFDDLPEGKEAGALFAKLQEAEERNSPQDALPEYAQYLRKVADDYRSGRLAVSKEDGYETLRSRWRSLDRLSSRLEVLLQKQLRQLDWNKEEAKVIKEYGGEMAYIMGYFGNVHSPLDDSPRWVELAAFPNRGTLFAAATGRPRIFYVLYPWKGIEVFCVGSVIPYFEYEGSKRLTDEEWNQTLGSPEAPKIPDWASSLYFDSEKATERVRK